MPSPVRALGNRNFQRLLLALAGIPVVLVYLWRALIVPVLMGADIGDFQESYMRAAARLSTGGDPYDLCRVIGCAEPTGPQYVMPPLLAWLLQPLVGVDRRLITLAVVLCLNISLALFLFCVVRAMNVKDWHLAILLVLVAVSFGPVVGNIDEGQINLVLLALSGMWLLSWLGGGWWGGAALGAAVALKLIQAPLVVLVLWARRWSMLIAATVAGLGLWLLAAPQYLFEYLFQVLPVVSAGTGLYENHSPGGTITRLLEPATFLGAERGSPTASRVITAAIAVAALAITLVVLRTPAVSRTGRSLEAAAIIAVTPLMASYSWGTHLVLLLLPMLVLVVWGVRNRDWTVLALVAMGSLLIGPWGKWLQVLLVSGYSNLLVLRLMDEYGVISLVTIWIGCLLAVHRERSPRTQAALIGSRLGSSGLV